MDEFLYVLIIFLTGTLSSIILYGLTDLATILKTLSVIILVFLITLKINIKQDGSKIKNSFIKITGLFFMALFIMLLIIATGGIISPLIVVLHITTIALAFLLTFPIAMAFLAAALTSIFAQYYLAYKAHTLVIDPALLIIQLLSLAALIPFSSVISKRYHLKGKIADYLFAQLSLRKNEEVSILENIDEGVITLARDFSIIKMNKTGENLTEFGDKQIRGKNFFDVFKFFDQDKNPIGKDKFPIGQLSSKLTSFSESNLYVCKKDGTLYNIGFKFSSVLGSLGKIEEFLFVFGKTKQDAPSGTSGKVLLGSFNSFEKLVSEINKNIESLDIHDPNSPGLNILPHLKRNSKRMAHAYKNLELLYKLSMGEIPGLLSDLDVGDTVRKMIGQMEDLSLQYQVSFINSAPLSPPLPIKTNRIIFEEAIGKIIELAIFIAAQSPEKFIIVSTGSSPENIFVFVKISSYNNFPWEKAGELVKPFFGSLSDNHELAQASGLEGYLAESLLKEKGISGGITGSKFEDGLHNPQLILTVVLPFSNKS